ncbi:hypothetical protein ACFO0M_17455 [Micromonospora mangrovi]|uniref:Uncharacterized protein n=2 Tax=Micromonospora TaxID=1873 RepID=A0AAU8HFS7_9ACTN
MSAAAVAPGGDGWVVASRDGGGDAGAAEAETGAEGPAPVNGDDGGRQAALLPGVQRRDEVGAVAVVLCESNDQASGLLDIGVPAARSVGLLGRGRDMHGRQEPRSVLVDVCTGGGADVLWQGAHPPLG